MSEAIEIGVMTGLMLALAACGEPEAPGGADSAGIDAPGTDAGDVDGPEETPRLADVVHAAPGASGSGFGDPDHAVNGVRGQGLENGSTDVYSLGLSGANDSITLAWSAGRLRNVPGDDLAVFENPFNTPSRPFMDLVIVEVSRDAVTWRALAHDYVAADETVYAADPAAWVGFAGRTPVMLHAENNPVDPFDRAAAGGDGFDLDDVEGDDAEAAAIRAEGIRYVRLVAAPTRLNPDTGARYVQDTLGNGADIDGVFGRNVAAD